MRDGGGGGGDDDGSSGGDGGGGGDSGSGWCTCAQTSQPRAARIERVSLSRVDEPRRCCCCRRSFFLSFSFFLAFLVFPTRETNCRLLRGFASMTFTHTHTRARADISGTAFRCTDAALMSQTRRPSYPDKINNNRYRALARDTRPRRSEKTHRRRFRLRFDRTSTLSTLPSVIPARVAQYAIQGVTAIIQFIASPSFRSPLLERASGGGGGCSGRPSLVTSTIT